jgi:hypothetical protein
LREGRKRWFVVHGNPLDEEFPHDVDNYRHSPGKDALICASLEYRHQRYFWKG